MHAVIQAQGRQYRVSEGDVIDIPLQDLKPGGTLTFSEVKLIEEGDRVRIGAPDVEGAAVTATVVGESKGPKVRGISFRRRKGSKVTKGHRQHYTRVKITKIEG
ncbi:MAG: 50S ribosomal protein L21 [Planctomycetota bacterium]